MPTEPRCSPDATAKALGLKFTKQGSQESNLWTWDQVLDAAVDMYELKRWRRCDAAHHQRRPRCPTP